ncbi:MAG: SMI1/KNR4 family protein [Planctomycetota bacterium]
MPSDQRQRQSAIEQLESRIGCTLPADYREFLMHDDPLSYCYQVFPVSPAIGGSNQLPINLLCEAWCEPDEFSSVEANYEVLASREQGDGMLPPETVPIGDCVDDIYILLYVAGDRVGEVWIKDYIYLDEGKEDTPQEGLQRVARSFTEFLGSLRE